MPSAPEPAAPQRRPGITLARSSLLAAALPAQTQPAGGHAPSRRPALGYRAQPPLLGGARPGRRFGQRSGSVGRICASAVGAVASRARHWRWVLVMDVGPRRPSRRGVLARRSAEPWMRGLGSTGGPAWMSGIRLAAGASRTSRPWSSGCAPTSTTPERRQRMSRAGRAPRGRPRGRRPSLITMMAARSRSTMAGRRPSAAGY